MDKNKANYPVKLAIKMEERRLNKELGWKHSKPSRKQGNAFEEGA